MARLPLRAIDHVGDGGQVAAGDDGADAGSWHLAQTFW
jgi:hypothetical protein